MHASRLAALAGAAFLAVGCAGHDDAPGTTAATRVSSATQELAPGSGVTASTGGVPADVYVRVETSAQPCSDDTRFDCPGGYWVQELNRETPPQLVPAIDVAELGREALDQAAGVGPGQLLLRGRFGSAAGVAPGAFVALEAWRGMPGVHAAAEDRYVAIASINDVRFAKVLDTPREQAVTSVSLRNVALPFVDASWLGSRVYERGAIVAGRFDDARFVAAQVYVRLPDVSGPCPLLQIACGKETPTYERDSDRCLIPTGCVVRRACPFYMPRCAPGYRLVSWPSKPSGCLAFACDPTFLTR